MPPTTLVSCHFGTTIVQQPRAWNLDDFWDLASKQDPSAYGKLRLQRPSDQKTARWWLTYSLICICWDTYVRMIMCTPWYVIIPRILHVKFMPSAVWSGSHHALAPANERLIYPRFSQFRSAGIPHVRRLQQWIMPCEDLVAWTGTGQRYPWPCQPQISPAHVSITGKPPIPKNWIPHPLQPSKRSSPLATIAQMLPKAHLVYLGIWVRVFPNIS